MPSFLSNIIAADLYSHSKLWTSAKAETGVGPLRGTTGDSEGHTGMLTGHKLRTRHDSCLNLIQVSTGSLVGVGVGSLEINIRILLGRNLLSIINLLLNCKQIMCNCH